MRMTLDELINAMEPQARKDKALISKCVDGLTEYAAELRQKAGDAGKEQISALRRLVDELAGYWGLDAKTVDHVTAFDRKIQEVDQAVHQWTPTLRERGIAAAPLRSQYKDWNADLKALHGLPAEPAEEHPQLLAADPICQRIGAAVSSGVAKPEQAEQKLPILLQDYKNHLHQGRFDRAMDAMELAAAMALSSALREFRQMGKVVSPQQGAERLRQSIQPHHNRGSLKNRADEIAMELQRKLRELRKLRRRLLEAAGEDRQIHDTERMMEYLEDGPEWLDEVPAELFGELIERIIIISPERLKFRLLNGMELAENIERTVR